MCFCVVVFVVVLVVVLVIVEVLAGYSWNGNYAVAHSGSLLVCVFTLLHSLLFLLLAVVAF